MKKFLLLFLVFLLLQSLRVLASSDMPRIIRIEGVITNHTYTKIQKDLANWKNHDPIPAGLIVLLNSLGGNGEIAMQIGRLLRQHNAQAFVNGNCESACVFILAGGVVRAANTGSVGVHAGRLTITSRDGGIIKEIDASQSLENSFKLTSFNSMVNQYLFEMGIRNGLMDVMLSYKSKQTFKLTEMEMLEFGIVGFDNEYLRKRGDLFALLPKSERINRIQLYNRTLSIPKLCSSQSNDVFIKCYESVLLGKIPL